jgi:hypothetical protein
MAKFSERRTQPDPQPATPQVPAEELPGEPAAPLMPTGADLPQSVTLDAFCHNAVGAKHLDQVRAFAGWCRQTGHRRHSVAEWQALLAEFHQRPVGAQS